MTHGETQAGTPVLEMSPEEYRDFCQRSREIPTLDHGNSPPWGGAVESASW